jgi:hypothetical protein
LLALLEELQPVLPLEILVSNVDGDIKMKKAM